MPFSKGVVHVLRARVCRQQQQHTDHSYFYEESGHYFRVFSVARDEGEKKPTYLIMST